MRAKRGTVRNFEIHPDRSRVAGVPHVEIGPGRYAGNRWREGQVFIDEDSFSVVEGIIKKHFRKYERHEVNNISQTKGMQIVANLREAAGSILACSGKEIFDPIEYRADSSPKTIQELVRSRGRISEMLSGLADFLENAYESNEWICILGAERPTDARN